MAVYNVAGFRDTDNTGLYVYYVYGLGIFSAGANRKEALKHLREDFREATRERSTFRGEIPGHLEMMAVDIFYNRLQPSRKVRVACRHTLQLYHFGDNYSPLSTLVFEEDQEADELGYQIEEGPFGCVMDEDDIPF